MRCDAQTPVMGVTDRASCEREAGHYGEHQGELHSTYRSWNGGPSALGEAHLWVSWDRPGNSTSSHLSRLEGLTACPQCGTKERITPPSVRCFHCLYWEARIDTYAEGLSFAQDGVMYSFGGVGCFGGRIFTVTFHDGRVVDPAHPWYNGPIPALFRDLFPDNATISNGRPDPDPRARAY